MRGRLFKRLEKRIERTLGQHVHLVDQVHLVAAARWRILNVIEQITRVIHLRFGRRINLNQIDKTALVNLDAGAALTTGFRCDALLAIQRLGQDTGDGRLANTACSGKKIRMMQPPRIEGIDQGLENMLLANGIRKVFGPPFAGEDDNS